MNRTHSTATRWAILIGVGGLRGYENQNRSVKGAIGDVMAMKNYLKTYLAPVQVRTLTTQRLDQDQPRIEASLQDAPTYDNVINQLQEVIKHGQRGDYVYIHFSGHGTNNQGSLALVLYEAKLANSRLLYGIVLRSAINRMVSAGMLVTLVLDCCFSGNVLRNGHLQPSGIRYIEYDTTMDLCSDHIDPFAEECTRSSSLTLVKGAEAGQRLLDPTGYSVLSACDSHEEAGEVILPDGANRGALSYFLLDSLTILRNRGVEVSHHSLHQHVRGNFHARHGSQTPMLYGSNGLSFFNDLARRSFITFVSAHRDNMDNLVLDAGEVNGVHVGDEYALYDFAAPETSIAIRKEAHIKAKVVTVDHFASKLCIDDCSEDQKVAQGWTCKAKMLTTLSPHPVRMMLIRGAPNARDLLDEAKKIPFLHLVLQDDQDRGDGSESDPRERAVFQVTARGDCTYEVLDQRAEKVENFPVINTSASGANQALLKALGHIAAFKFYERIENLNPDPQFEASFSLACPDQTPDSNGIYKMKHHECFKLHFKNLGTVPKYVAVMDFDCSWEISNPILCGGEGYSLTILPKGSNESGEKEIPLRMEVPSDLLDRGRRHANDVRYSPSSAMMSYEGTETELNA
ncbi:uncharacterized protein NECHADRAFT_88415 [Fusarium vanettenii 77-13-4]|uniref:Peptidase C14 caspase domain-containing protein n=1 Tax=Fusarium vanettenii (strain ATCC MYA-4622 / CBS 123669 / FGSC 9596 / NRRL 45880 / 77-13-4) TaxID=660122 RepID=C7ZMC9_FUSV7|nr:uncharacterized protein NECHADRAFT_88415 [Fusarium vanettenii 77-13-4]EEU34831.1 hypothetical protein NECHADRAFT_88415 [Fusarium vanettenii 77-13-4]